MASNASLRARRISPLIFLGLISAGVVLPAPPAMAAPSCSSFSVGVYDRVNPTTQVQGITRSWTESREYANNGFSHSRGVPFKVATSSGASLGAVHRLYRPSSGNLFYSLDSAEISRATSSLGYVDQGTVFYAGTSAASCLLPVTDYYRAGIHRFVTSSAEGASLAANGWARTRVRFYVAKPPSDPKFAIAVMPDTQQEVKLTYDTRLLNRTQWLASNKTSLDLRYVTHDGDVVNWDTPDHVQYIQAQSAMKVLKDNRIPFSLTVGNHDTAAVCPGGSACPGANTSITVRDTTSFNRYLAAGVDNLGGRFEASLVSCRPHTGCGSRLRVA